VSFIDHQTLDFLLYDWLKVEELTRYARYKDHSPETFDSILELSAKIAASEFATHYKKSDREEPYIDASGVHVLPEIKTALAAFAEAGFFGATFESDLGGLQLPNVIQTAAMAHFMAANIATAAFPMLTCANARVIARFGTEAQKWAFARPQIDGRWFGTMCLSEPQAGSSLSDITTRAVIDGHDSLGPNYRVFGRKMWISGGDHDACENIVHLVLAKVPGEEGRLLPGMGGISLFVVPKRLLLETGEPGEMNDVVVAGLNHKMGYRGISNCALNFGEGSKHSPVGRDGAVGYLVGQVGQGLAIMFHMMNEARIAIGLGATALALRGYRHSVDYARERPQGRLASISGKNSASPQVAIIEHADVKHMLLRQRAYAEGALALILYCARLVDDGFSEDEAERADATILLDLLTPVAKSWPSEFGLAANDLAIQVHGGYGYTRDFDVEQLYRDNRLNPIHEGTNGIQAIDLVGRKIIRDRGTAIQSLGQRIMATIERAGLFDELEDYCRILRQAWAATSATVSDLVNLNDTSRGMDHASSFLSAFGHVVVAWLWLDQTATLLKVTDRDSPARTARLLTCRYFIEVELPKIYPQLDLVRSLNDVARAMPADAF